MGVVACEHCGKEKAKTAKTCVHCGGKDSRITSGCAKVVVFVIASVFVLVAISQCQDAADPAGAARRQKSSEQSLLMTALENRCEDAVREKLKAPSTAKFVGSPEIRVHKDDAQQFFVVGKVDAQNGFGAMLRNEYVCKARKTGPDWNDVQITEAAVGIP